MARSLKFNKFGLDENPRGLHVTMETKDHGTLLGEVVDHSYVHARGMFALNVRHFNGEPWPITPVASAVTVIG